MIQNGVGRGYPHLSLHPIRLGPGYQWSSEAKDLFFFFPVLGAGLFRRESLLIPVSIGDVVALGGDPLTRLTVPAGGHLETLCFSCNPKHLFQVCDSQDLALLQEIGDCLTYPVRHDASTTLAQKCHRLVREAITEESLVQRSQLLRVASEIVAVRLKKTDHRCSGFMTVQAHLCGVLDNLTVDEILTFSVAELSARFGCSRRHLNRLFHEYFGVSANGLRMEMRLLKAAALLCETNSKIIEVAERSGFNHLGQFNTCFKRRFGASPRAWRESAPVLRKSQNSLVQLEVNCHMRAQGLCPWSTTECDSIRTNSAQVGALQTAMIPNPRPPKPLAA